MDSALRLAASMLLCLRVLLLTFDARNTAFCIRTYSSQMRLCTTVSVPNEKIPSRAKKRFQENSLKWRGTC